MSTSPIQANLAPSWKQEVNRRIAAHRNRKDGSDATPGVAEPVHAAAGSRAAQAAARVAARFASAPSYSEVLADEARAAVRAAEAASRAALQAQAAAESVLAGLEAASAAAEPVWTPAPRAVTPEPRLVKAHPAEPHPAEPHPAESRIAERDVAELRGAAPRVAEAPRVAYAVRWAEDFPVRAAEPEPVRTLHGEDPFDTDADAWMRSLHTREYLAVHAVVEPMLAGEEIQPVEPAQAIHANLIEFPRELVATRKIRPRLAEAAHTEQAGQLSIFEVDPVEVSTEPSAVADVQASAASAAPAWPEPEWSSIKLDAEPAVPTLVQPTVPEPEERRLDLELASMSRRLLALVVDGALVTSAFLAAVYVATSHMSVLPVMRTAEIGAAAALVVMVALYAMLFFTLGTGTPGMKYAGIQLRTLEGRRVSRAQRWNRLGALALSLLPLGLGVAWALFDEDRLSWHDRLSGTYLKNA